MIELLSQLPAFLSTHAHLAYLVLFALSFAETLIGVGFFVYGELIFLPAAALAGAGVLNVWLVSAALFAGGIMGDGASFWIGHRYGSRVLGWHDNWLTRIIREKGEAFFAKYGPSAAFFARFMGPLSWVTPFLAGTHGMPYRRFFVYNTPGVILGISQFIVAGYVGGKVINLIPPELRHIGIGVLVALFVAIIGYHVYKSIRDRE